MLDWMYFLVTMCCLKVCDSDIIQNTYDKQPYYQLQSPYDSKTVENAVSCVATCNLATGCKGVSYNRNDRQCILAKDQSVVSSNVWNTYIMMTDWQLVFRAVSGNGDNVRDAWLSGLETSAAASCTTFDSTCMLNYRDPIVDTWTTLGIQEVKYALYVGTSEVAYVTFGAVGSDLKSWFHKDRVIDSSWSTLAQGSFNYFSIDGDDGRNFFINVGYSFCYGDSTYTMAVRPGSYSCTFDNLPTVPEFLYSRLDGYVSPISADFVAADFMAIFIKT